MSEDNELIPAEGRMFSMKDIATALFERHGITSGLYQLGLSLRFAGVTMDWTSLGSAGFVPTGLIGFEAIGLKPADKPGEMVFDAAELTKQKPAVKKRAIASKRAAA